MNEDNHEMLLNSVMFGCAVGLAFIVSAALWFDGFTGVKNLLGLVVTVPF